MFKDCFIKSFDLSIGTDSSMDSSIEVGASDYVPSEFEAEFKDCKETIKYNDYSKLGKISVKDLKDITYEEYKDRIMVEELWRNYIVKMLDSKSPEYITENFDYVVEMFEKAEDDEAVILSEEAHHQAASREVAPPTSELIDESVSDSQDDRQSGATDYITELKKLDYKR